MQENFMMSLEVSVARFSPMRRLLSGEDEDFLARQGFRHEAVKLRADHRNLYFRFVDMLERDFSTVHAARKTAMGEKWDMEQLLKERFTASYYLWAMRAAGIMHLMHLPQASQVAEAYCDRVKGFMPGSVPVAR
jgi:hypothetical protein